MSIITVGIDLAKNVFAVHGVNDNGKAALVKPKVAATNCWNWWPSCRRA
jgi:transposase